MEESLREKTVSSVIWSIVERFGLVVVKFVLGVVLARLLLPTDFGLFGIIAVFFEVANELIQGGFGHAFIQKKNTTKVDEASVFYLNLTVSILLYAIFWFGAPFIAEFYTQPLLVPLTRVGAIVIIFDAFCVIRMASLMKSIHFKERSVIMLISTLIAGGISIALALRGVGVWALVSNALLTRLFITVGLWFRTPAVSIRHFSFASVKEMFAFGSWLLFAAIFRKIFENINVLVIGKLFPTATLGFFYKARQFRRISSGQVTQAFASVSFPVFSIIKDNHEKLRKSLIQFIEQALLINIPIVVTLFVVSNSFVLLFLTEKWMPIVPYIKLFCLIGLIFPINAINTQVIIAMGKSKYNFVLALIKNSLRIINLAVMYRHGVIYILAGEVVVSYFSLFINTYYAGQVLHFGLFKQLYALRFLLIGALVSGVVGVAATYYIENNYLHLIIGGVTTTLTFAVVQFFLNRRILQPFFEVLLKIKGKITG